MRFGRKCSKILSGLVGVHVCEQCFLVVLLWTVEVSNSRLEYGIFVDSFIMTIVLQIMQNIICTQSISLVSFTGRRLQWQASNDVLAGFRVVESLRRLSLQMFLILKNCASFPLMLLNRRFVSRFVRVPNIG